MFTIGLQPTEKGPTVISPERYYLTEDRTEAVKEGDPRAAFLLVGKGCEIDIETARRFGIAEAPAVAAEPVVVPAEPAPAPEVPPAPSKPPVFKKS